MNRVTPCGRCVIQERDTNNTPTVSYTRGTDLSGTMEGAGGIGGLLARSDGYSSGNWSTHNFYFADGNGNITYLVNSSQTWLPATGMIHSGTLFPAAALSPQLTSIASPAKNSTSTAGCIITFIASMIPICRG